MKDLNQIDICKDFSDHVWIETYYGYKCEKCRQFYAYGNAPWEPYCSICFAMTEDECVCGDPIEDED
jgi:hypothetical protein